jgi:hypothetical protein
MGIGVLVLGRSGSGKSTSMRNLKDFGLFNVGSKRLPFKTDMKTIINTDDYTKISSSLSKNKLNQYVIDDSQFLMANALLNSKDNSYGKWTDLARSFHDLIITANNTSDDTIVYFLNHLESTDSGEIKAKTVGKLLDNHFVVESLFPIVLIADYVDGEYVFRTGIDGHLPAKTPIGMFDATTIPNDLAIVSEAIKDFYGLSTNGKDK